MHNNSSTYLLHKCICNKVTCITNCYNEKSYVYTKSGQCYVYKKEYSLFGSPAHLHRSCINVKKITSCTSSCPQYKGSKKCYVYKQSRQCYVYKNEYSLLLTNFELSLEVASNMKIL